MSIWTTSIGIVIPVKTGIQKTEGDNWIPASAGMTGRRKREWVKSTSSRQHLEEPLAFKARGVIFSSAYGRIPFDHWTTNSGPGSPFRLEPSPPILWASQTSLLVQFCPAASMRSPRSDSGPKGERRGSNRAAEGSRRVDFLIPI